VRSVLEVRGIRAGYDGAPVVHDIDLRIPAGAVTCLLGPNGTGKSTLAKVVSGLLTPTRGSITVDQTEITHLSADQRVKLGISLVPEGRHLFSELTVRDNLSLGAYTKSSAERRRGFDHVISLFPPLEALLGNIAGDLSGGEQQMVAIGRALMAGPRFLVLDEPSLALAPILVRVILAKARQLADEGAGVLLIEQNVAASLDVSDTAVVLEQGRVLLSGSVDEVRDDPRVVASYLGGVI
jgi:branched-chain amino acid transport system ATP-binding protein